MTPASPPRDNGDFARFLTALVTRYGPNGSLWAEHPEVSRQPVRSWQIWNEPNLTRYWNVAPWAPSYVALLKRAHKALKAADPGSQTVLAGLPNESWKALEAIYDAGARRSFDVVTLHPYTGQPKNVVRIVKIVRRLMERRKDGKLPIWVTELSWPAAAGQDGPAPRLRDDRPGPVVTAGQGPADARRRAQAARDRPRLLVHVALPRGHHRQRLRLLRAAAPARRPGRQRARP